METTPLAVTIANPYQPSTRRASTENIVATPVADDHVPDDGTRNTRMVGHAAMLAFSVLGVGACAVAGTSQTSAVAVSTTQTSNSIPDEYERVKAHLQAHGEKVGDYSYRLIEDKPNGDRYVYQGLYETGGGSASVIVTTTKAAVPKHGDGYWVEWSDRRLNVQYNDIRFAENNQPHQRFLKTVSPGPDNMSGGYNHLIALQGGQVLDDVPRVPYNADQLRLLEKLGIQS